ncbi:MAG: hypothetical protein M3370_00845 [Actinomycetota bacterium]|nr:hypothetical protein [Actinomycetota bacterium]
MAQGGAVGRAQLLARAIDILASLRLEGDDRTVLEAAGYAVLRVRRSDLGSRSSSASARPSPHDRSIAPAERCKSTYHRLTSETPAA